MHKIHNISLSDVSPDEDSGEDMSDDKMDRNSGVIDLYGDILNLCHNFEGVSDGVDITLAAGLFIGLILLSMT